MRGYFWPRTARRRLLLAAYVGGVAALGVGVTALDHPLSGVAQALGYVLMAPMTILALPTVGAVETRLYSAVGYSETTQTVTIAVLFGLFALLNACLITYLRSSDPRF